MIMAQVPEVIIGRELSERRQTLAVAESCTGGLVCHRITRVPGSSAYFVGGVVAYSPAVKEKLLGVPYTTLITHGVVSVETALEMARGVRRLLGTDFAIAVTGFAGPAAEPGRPPGLVYVALVGPGVEYTERLLERHDRVANQEEAATAALRLLAEHLQPAVSGPLAGQAPADPH